MCPQLGTLVVRTHSYVVAVAAVAVAVFLLLLLLLLLLLFLLCVCARVCGQWGHAMALERRVVRHRTPR
jgi:hypothetical protein